MPKPVYTTINQHGNLYTKYDNGSYRYVNTDAWGRRSHYYNTGNGCSFFTKNNPDGYSWYQNDKNGTRKYFEKPIKKERSMSPKVKQ